VILSGTNLNTSSAKSNRGAINRIAALSFIILTSAKLSSQTPPYYHYDHSDGLPSETVYQMIQDRSGYLWLATANGVSKFDGHKFINYSVKDGLNANNVNWIVEGPDAELFFNVYGKGFNKYENGKITNYSRREDANTHSSALLLDQSKLYDYGVAHLELVNPDKTHQIYGGLTKRIEPWFLNFMLKLSDGSVLGMTSMGIYKLENENFRKLSIEGFDDSEIFYAVEDKYGNIVAGGYNRIFIINKLRVISSVQTKIIDHSKIYRLVSDSRGDFWFSVMNKGIYFIERSTHKIVDVGKKLGLENTQVNFIFEDNERNIWVATFGKGLFCLNNLYITNFSEGDGLSNDNVYAILRFDTETIALGTFDRLNIFENGRFKSVSAGRFHLTEYITDIELYEGSIFVSGSDFGLLNTISKRYKNINLYFFTAASMLFRRHGKFVTGYWDNIIYEYPKFTPDQVYGQSNFIPKDSKVDSLFPDIANNRVNVILEDSRNNLWVGTALGVCRLANGEKTFFPDNPVLNTTVKAIVQNKDDIWFAGDKGIAKFNMFDGGTESYESIVGFDLSSSNALAVDGNNRLWIGTSHGLFIINPKSPSAPSQWQLKVLNHTNGLPTNNIYSLFYDSLKNYMWAGGDKGLSSIDLDRFDNRPASSNKIQIKTVKAGDSVFAIYGELIFEPEQNNIFIDFTSINYSSPKSVNYQYKLTGDWQDLPEDFINFTSIEHGEYKLSIRAKSINSEWGTPAELSFTVKPRYYQTFWFSATIAALVGVAAGLITSARIRYVRRRKTQQWQIRNQMNELKHRALSAMMNPHFIFNSLNSIQHLINVNKRREANDYVSLMARLMRMTLDSAAETFIKLDEEIKRIKLYLDIEKLRFEDKIRYEIAVDNKLDPGSVKIPNMIIQPFIENSIWHGIMPLEGEGIIRISFQFENVSVNSKVFKFLIIRITDNGVGLGQVRKTLKEGHISKGMKLVQDRLAILSKEKDLPMPIIIEDLGQTGKSRQGTEVVLSLPPDLYSTEGREKR
jgi:ligand-binding sensor domain-containing protein